LATRTLLIDATIGELDPELLARHFDRKHGPAAYYGQPAGAAPGADNRGSGVNSREVGEGGEGDRVR
jgi:hypothetical protein